MRRLATTLALAAALAFPVAASAYPGEQRADQGFGGGPHCHMNTKSGHLVFPSHKGHLAQINHRPGGPVFSATACPS